ncbi:MAG: DUF177 domain-containing protein [Actinobacteria bacterium]|nr:DUF177 domain-containing protein [Actinomycetota bacterium]
MRNPLLVNALELLRRPGTHKDVELAVAPSVLGIDDRRLLPESDIDVRVLCESLSDGIVVEGRVQLDFRGECRRCLTPLTGTLSIEVHELYQVAITDPDAFPIENDQIDLATMVRESVLLDLPNAPVCRADCAGLCPVCGADRNTLRCGCPATSPDPRWAALDALREQLPE